MKPEKQYRIHNIVPLCSGHLEISMSLRLQYVGEARNINGICKLS